jgi:renal tumor antigen
MELNFPEKVGTGLLKLMPAHASPECVDLIEKMLIYNPEERISAKQCLKHVFFKDLRELEKRQKVNNV